MSRVPPNKNATRRWKKPTKQKKNHHRISRGMRKCRHFARTAELEESHWKRSRRSDARGTPELSTEVRTRRRTPAKGATRSKTNPDNEREGKTGRNDRAKRVGAEGCQKRTQEKKRRGKGK